MEDAKICCFTGHRKLNVTELTRLSSLLDDVLDRLIAGGVRVFRTGGAIGFDTLAALKVLEKREKDPSLSLELWLPCRDQTRGWGEVDRKYYRYILEQADRIEYLHEEYVTGCMLERNRALVTGSQFCVGYCNKTSGGSAYTLSYANRQGLRVINLSGLL